MILLEFGHGKDLSRYLRLTKKHHIEIILGSLRNREKRLKERETLCSILLIFKLEFNVSLIQSHPHQQVSCIHVNYSTILNLTPDYVKLFHSLILQVIMYVLCFMWTLDMVGYIWSCIWHTLCVVELHSHNVLE